MNAEIITTGTELLLGEIVDTNAAFIARQLREVGVNLFYKTTVGDNRQRLAEVLRLGIARSDVILLTGGLGPTVDDITREAVADAVGQPLELRPELADHLRAQFHSWGRNFTENNLRQAYLPVGAEAIPNPIGTAPGFVVPAGRAVIIGMPGVPREMKRMMADYVLPFLQQRLGDGAGVIVARVLHVAGVGESVIDDRIGSLMAAGNPTVGLAAHMGRVDIRIAARAADRAAAESLITPVEAEIRKLLGRWIYGADDETLGSVITAALRQRAAVMAVAETNTRGVIVASLGAEVAACLKMQIQAESASDLARQLDAAAPQVPALAVNEASARLAAEHLLAYSGADVALAVLGTTLPNQGFWAPDRGETWIGIAVRSAEDTVITTERFPVGGLDDYTGHWLAVYCLNALRRRLMPDSV